MSIRVLYTDVDGTLVGPLGNLFHDGERQFHLDAASALGLAAERGLEIVPLSGRSRPTLMEVARIIGAATWIGELGAVRSYDYGAEIVLDQGEYPGEGPAIDELRAIADHLIRLHPGRLEEHGPWNALRETSFMVRGALDLDAVNQWLSDEGAAWVECTDNGVIPRSFEGLDVERVRVYHLSPKGVSKHAAVAADQLHRGLRPEECAVIGDARSDLECAPNVARAFLVANALDKDPDLEDVLALHDNAEVTPRGYGQGFADAVATLVEA